jgi:hypothetical protein
VLNKLESKGRVNPLPMLSVLLPLKRQVEEVAQKPAGHESEKDSDPNNIPPILS